VADGDVGEPVLPHVDEIGQELTRRLVPRAWARIGQVREEALVIERVVERGRRQREGQHLHREPEPVLATTAGDVDRAAVSAGRGPFLDLHGEPHLPVLARGNIERKQGRRVLDPIIVPEQRDLPLVVDDHEAVVVEEELGLQYLVTRISQLHARLIPALHHPHVDGAGRDRRRDARCARVGRPDEDLDAQGRARRCAGRSSPTPRSLARP